MAIQLIQIMECITMAVTLCMFTTGFPPILHMYRTKETRNVPFHMFLMASIGCLGMFHYGLMVENSTLVFLNAIGSCLQCSYVIVYILIAPAYHKAKATKYLTAGVLYMTSLYCYLYMAIHKDVDRQDTLGMMSSLITTIMVCLPALEVVGNIRNRNADGMPVIMLIGGLACSTSWLIYGYMLNDPNVYAPNIPGLAITIAKLYVIRIYSRPIKVKRS